MIPPSVSDMQESRWGDSWLTPIKSRFYPHTQPRWIRASSHSLNGQNLDLWTPSLVYQPKCTYLPTPLSLEIVELLNEYCSKDSLSEMHMDVCWIHYVWELHLTIKTHKYSVFISYQMWTKYNSACKKVELLSLGALSEKSQSHLSQLKSSQQIERFRSKIYSNCINEKTTEWFVKRYICYLLQVYQS